jgi:hypothetical protein
MKGDFSKDTFNTKKHFHDVLMQQGRVLLDADWNEQAGIAAYRVETGTKDIIGLSGAPLHNAGFQLIPVNSLSSPPAAGGHLKISKGHFYVDGILCENEEEVLFVNQPDFDFTPLPTAAGTYIFYLDVWHRHITATENPDIREVALGGPDTTTRAKTIWQVKFVKSEVLNINCLTGLPPDIINLPDGTLAARSELTTGSSDPCGLTASGGYKRLENQLYRVEIHIAGNRTKATFKWSRDNGSIIVKWEQPDISDPNKLIVSSTGRDELLSFKAGDWIEVIDDKSDLLNKPGVLAELSRVEGNVLTIRQSSIQDLDNPLATTVNFNNRKNPRIRRWDSAGDLTMNANNTAWVPLEEGVEVNFGSGTYKSGDYWLIPARTAKADVEWPTDPVTKLPLPQLPQGITHHFSELAISKLETGAWTVLSDCRPVFPPVTELTTLYYVSGDGQEARPGIPLAGSLKVGVSNGQWPVNGAKIKFEILSGGGTLNPGTGFVSTAANGIAECTWIIGDKDSPQNQQVKATLLNAAGIAVHLPVIFNAKLTPPAMFYVSGDGQEAMPGDILPIPLRVGVAYEQFQALGAKIEFKIESGGGTFDDGTTDFKLLSLANGIAECKKWKLGATGIQQVRATLSDAANNLLHLPIIFTASFNLASNVKYDGAECNNWGDHSHETVAEAITALCKRENKKGCMVTVGNEGQFLDLKEAFHNLDKEMDIFICLLPQRKDHEFDDLVVNEKRTIKIVGGGTNINMVGGQLSLTAEKIIFNGFNLVVTQKENAQIILTAIDVNIDHCTFTSILDGRKIPLIVVNNLPGDRIIKDAVIHLDANSFFAAIPLALSPEVGGWIRNNLFSGEILLQFVADRFFPLQWKKIGNRDDIEKMLPKNLKIEHNSDVLHICNNVLINVLTNTFSEKEIIDDLVTGKKVDVIGYQSILISENIFYGARSSFIALLVTLSNNHFIRANDKPAGFALGQMGIVTGNVDPIYNGDGEYIIDTIFSQKIIVPNLLFVR